MRFTKDEAVSKVKEIRKNLREPDIVDGPCLFHAKGYERFCLGKTCEEPYLVWVLKWLRDGELGRLIYIDTETGTLVHELDLNFMRSEGP